MNAIPKVIILPSHATEGSWLGTSLLRRVRDRAVTVAMVVGSAALYGYRRCRPSATILILPSAACLLALLPAHAGILHGPVFNPGTGHSYYLLTQNTWTASEAEAVTLGGHLAPINDAAENQWVLDTFSMYGGSAKTLWIGLNDATAEGTFVWSSGDPSTYRNWYSGEPSNSGGNESYVHIYQSSHIKSGFWNDYTSNSVFLGVLPLHGVVEISFDGDRKITKTPTTPISAVAEPVDAATGAYYIDRQLLNLTGARELTLEIHYNSRLRNDGEPLGEWSHDYEAKVIVNGDTITLDWGGNRANSFALNPALGKFTGVENLVKFDQITILSTGEYQLIRKSGERYIFANNGKLTQLADKTGKVLNLAYDSVTGQLLTVTEPISGVALTFAYVPPDAPSCGKIRTVTASDGRRIEFKYMTWALDNISNGMVRLLSNIIHHSADGLINLDYAFTYYVNGILHKAMSPDGTQVISNTYDVLGRVVTQQDGTSPAITAGGVTIPAKTFNTTSFAYDDTTQPGYRITTVTDRLGGTIVFKHDANLQLVSKTDQLGHTTSYTYDANGNTASVTDPRGNTTGFQYDAAGNLTRSTDAEGKVTNQTYDGANNLLTLTNALNQTSTFTYDGSNRLLTASDAAGNTTTNHYDTAGLLDQSTSPRGGQTLMQNTNGLPTSITDATGRTAQLHYDAAGRLSGRIDGAGKQWTYTHDILDNPTSVSDPLGHAAVTTYGWHGKPLTATDELGRLTRFYYDANTNLRAKLAPDGGITVYDYDAEDRLVKVTDPLDRATNLTYDAAGHLLRITDASGRSVASTYDANGNVLQSVDGYGRAVNTAIYSPTDRLLSSTDALGNSSAYGRDVLGRQTSRTDPLGRADSYEYDPAGRLTTVQTPAGTTVGQGYDASGNRTSLTDPLGAATAFTHDLAGRMTKLTTSGGKETVFGYDNRGLIATATEPSGQQTTYSHDDAGRLTGRTDAVGTTTYGLDAKGQVLTVTENGQTITREYDTMGRVTRYVDGRGNEILYQYDLAGNLTTLTYPGGSQVLYEYDGANRLTKLTDWSNRITTFAYDANGRLVTMVRPNATVHHRKYDLAGRMTGLWDLGPGDQVIRAHALTWNAAGEITAEQINPQTADREDLPLVMTYGSDNRIATWAGQSTNFDADGNMLRGPLQGAMADFIFDARNRVTSAAGLTYAYDAEGNRISVSGLSGTTNFVVNPNASLSQVLAMAAPGGAVTRYVYGNGVLLYEESNGNARYYHHDFRGSTVALSNQSGAVAARIEYSPYGQVTTYTGDPSTPFLFNGAYGVQTDSNGLISMRARCYSPEARRFLSQDVLLGDPGDANTLNRFAFANGNPVSLIDPAGLLAFREENDPVNPDSGRHSEAYYLPDEDVIVHKPIKDGNLGPLIHEYTHHLQRGDDPEAFKKRVEEDRYGLEKEAYEMKAEYYRQHPELGGEPRAQAMLDKFEKTAAKEGWTRDDKWTCKNKGAHFQR